MTSLDRAKRFLAARTAKLALTAIPLAMAIPAAFGQGTTGFSFNTNSGCSVSPGFGTCSVGQLSSTGGNPLGNWVDIFTNGLVSPSSGSLTVSTNEGASGTVSSTESIPVSWDFTLSPFAAEQPQTTFSTGTFDVSLEWFLNGTDILTKDLGTLSGGTYMGSSSFTISGGTTLSSYRMAMVLTNDFGYNLNVPGGTSIDLNNVAGTPEPASFLLTGAGLLGLLRRFRRRKAPASNRVA